MKQSNILVYSMGRVGSVSVRKALERSGIQSFHVHYLLSSGEPGFGGPRMTELDSWIDWNRQVKIISLIRDPIERSLSSFLRQKKLPDLKTMTIAKAKSRFMAENRLYYTLRWFDSELSILLGLDVLRFLSAMNMSKAGHVRFMRKKYDVLVIKTESLDYKSKVLSDFVGRFVKIKRENVSLKRPRFSEHYARIIERIRFGSELIDEVYSSKLVQAAYTPSQIEEMKEKWT